MTAVTAHNDPDVCVQDQGAGAEGTPRESGRDRWVVPTMRCDARGHKGRHTTTAEAETSALVDGAPVTEQGVCAGVRSERTRTMPAKLHKPRSEGLDMPCYDGVMESLRCFASFVERITPTCSGVVRSTSDTEYRFVRDLLVLIRAACANVRGDRHA